MWRRGLLALLLTIVGCTASREGPAEPAEAAPPPAAPEVRATRTDLVYGYVDPITSALTTTSSIGGIPEAARGSVFVTDLSRSPEARQAARYVFVADLREPHADGSYPVSVASRYAVKAAPAEGDTASAGVVIYTTSWCGVCKKAKAFMKRLGVPFTERDVEASRSAAEELAAKAQKAHISPGGVPVIDVDGVLLQGLDEGALEAALRQKGLLH